MERNEKDIRQIYTRSEWRASKKGNNNSYSKVDIRRFLSEKLPPPRSGNRSIEEEKNREAKRTVEEHWNLNTDFLDKLSNIEYYPIFYFRMFSCLDIERVRVVIMGQSPYPNVEHACGIAFQVPDDATVCPPSLVNLFKELENDIGVPKLRMRDCIRSWIEQGVFLTNCSLTAGLSDAEYLNDHIIFWENFTISFVKTVSMLNIPIVFLGEKAWKYEKHCTHSKRLKLYHPASRDDQFVNSKMFSKINSMLEYPINWLAF